MFLIDNYKIKTVIDYLKQTGYARVIPGPI